MIKSTFCFRMFIFSFAILCAFPSSAQNSTVSVSIPGRHRGAVTAVLRDEKGKILSAGEDGFLEIWNNQAAEERFQLSPYGITSMALRPGKSQVCVVESDGLSLYRISAWDYEKKTNLFTLSFRDAVSYINYSAAGSFLIVARSGRTGAAFINAETGEVLESPVELSDTITFAATSRSEKVMICYLPSGVLSYWDLETGNELQHFSVPPNITTPALFGNYCFLGGFDSQGLLIIDAVTGMTIARDQYARQGRIFVDNSVPSDASASADKNSASNAVSSAQFNYLTSAGGTSSVYRMEINLYGRLTTVTSRTVPASITGITSITSGDGGNVIIGTGGGALWLFGSSASLLNTGNPERIIDAAASPFAIAFISERGVVGYLPLDYTQLAQDSIITLEDATDPNVSGAYTSIVSDSSGSASLSGSMNPGTPVSSSFLLWRPGVSRSIPMLKTLLYTPPVGNSPVGNSPAGNSPDGNTSDGNSSAGFADGTAGGNLSAGIDTSQFLLEKLPQRYPLRSAAILGKSLLFLDSAGTATILDSDSGDVLSSYSAAGAVDAAFINEDTIILARSVISGSSPFLTVNISTGETVPLSYPAVAGVRVYRGPGGAIYGAVVNQASGNAQTSIIRLDLRNPAQSARLVNYNGEDSSFVLAESGGNLASTLGGGGATLYRGDNAEMIHLERSAGLPVKIISGTRWFIVLDGEGGIAWHDNMTGKLLAVLRLSLQGNNGSSPGTPQLYPNLWTLEKFDPSTGDSETISGALKKK